MKACSVHTERTPRTSDDQVRGRRQLVHTCLDHADVLPSVLQLDVSDHQVTS